MEFDIIKIVQSVGFPIAVAFWFMWRTDKRIDKLTDIIRKLAENGNYKCNDSRRDSDNNKPINL